MGNLFLSTVKSTRCDIESYTYNEKHDAGHSPLLLCYSQFTKKTLFQSHGQAFGRGEKSVQLWRARPVAYLCCKIQHNADNRVACKVSIMFTKYYCTLACDWPRPLKLLRFLYSLLSLASILKCSVWFTFTDMSVYDDITYHWLYHNIWIGLYILVKRSKWTRPP